MNSLYGDFRNKRFDAIWESLEVFMNGDGEALGWKQSPFYTEGVVADKDVELTYYLLYANYGNSSIASNDVNRFMFKLFSLIYQYAPLWVKRTEIQKRLRGLTEEELREGSKTISNHANNPSSVPSSSSLHELNYIDDQSTTTFKKSKADAYAYLWEQLSQDVTKEFMDKFKDLFLKVVYPECEMLYPGEEDGNN